MLLQLIQDCTCIHVIDKIELVNGHRIESCLLTSCMPLSNKDDKVSTGIALPVSYDSSFTLISEDDTGEGDTNYGIWFVLHLLEWISINCAARQIEWCFPNKEPTGVKYVEDEEYNINMDELFDSTQRLIECMSDDRYSNIERHESMVQVLYHQVLPLIIISRGDTELLNTAANLQQSAINQLDGEFDGLNNMDKAYKMTLSNLQEKIVPDLIKYPQIRALFPEVTENIVLRIEIQLNKWKRVTLTPELRLQMDECSKALKQLQKRKKSVSGYWKRHHTELLNEVTYICETFQSAIEELQKVKRMEGLLMNAKVKATQIKEEIRSVEQRLVSHEETYGYDIPSSMSRDTLTHSHHSLHNAVLSIIQNVNGEVGQRHLLETSWIIEQCELTRVAWQDDPSLIPSTMNQMSFDPVDNDFLLVSEPDIFTVILEKISIQCAYTAGKLISLLPRIKPSPASTKRLIITYENIVYERLTPYILPLLELRYKNTLDKLTSDVRHLSWEEFDIEEDWIIQLLSTPSENPQPIVFHSETLKAQSQSSSLQPQNCVLDTKTEDGGLDQESDEAVLQTSETIPISSKPIYEESGQKLKALTRALSLPDEPTDSQAAVKEVASSTNNSPGYSDSGYHEICNSPITEDSVPTLESILESQNSFEYRPDRSPSSTISANSLRSKLTLDLTSVTTESVQAESSRHRTISLTDDTQSSDSKTSDQSLPPVVITTDPSSDRLDCASAGMKNDAENIGEATSQDKKLPLNPESHNSKNNDQMSHPPATPKNSPDHNGLTTPTPDPIVISSQTPTIENVASANHGSPLIDPSTEEPDTSAELDGLLDEALETLDVEITVQTEEIKEVEQILPRRISGARSLQRSQSTDPPIADKNSPSPSPSQTHKPFTKKTSRSKSVGAKTRQRMNASQAAKKVAENMAEYLKRPGTPVTPVSPLHSPRIRQIHAKTKKDVESVVMRRRSRRFQSKRSKSTQKTSVESQASTDSQVPSVLIVGTNQFTESFADSIQCLIDMETKHSPLQKAQMLAKCLRCMSSTISDIRAKGQAATSSDDLVTVAIVILLNIPPPDFRSLYIQLQFISTYMAEFMDAGIHNFACVQFIGAMHFIQDQILTRKYRVNGSESRC